MKKDQGTNCQFEKDQLCTFFKDQTSSKASDELIHEPTISVMDVNQIPNQTMYLGNKFISKTQNQAHNESSGSQDFPSNPTAQTDPSFLKVQMKVEIEAHQNLHQRQPSISNLYSQKYYEKYYKNKQILKSNIHKMTFKKNLENIQAKDQNEFTLEKNLEERSENENKSANSTNRMQKIHLEHLN